MKKLFLLFISVAMCLYGVMVCYADSQFSVSDILEDLPAALKYDTAENIEKITDCNKRLNVVLEEQRQGLYILNYIYYLGSYKGSINGNIIYDSMRLEQRFTDTSPLFSSEFYKGYYNARTQRVLKGYENSEVFDYSAFVKVARQDFDAYFKTAVKDQNNKDQLVLLLQEKMFGKLIEMEPINRKAAYEEIILLRQPSNSTKYLDHLFQFCESRVRLQLHEEMAELNKLKIETLLKKVGVIIAYDKKGQLMLQSKDSNNTEKPTQILNVLLDQEGFRGLTVMQELYGNENRKLVFIGEDNAALEVDIIQAIKSIAIDENGYIILDLNKLLTIDQGNNLDSASVNNVSANQDANILKTMEQLHASKTKQSQEIIKELNRYSIYRELKDKKITNYYTRNFEDKQKQWKKDLETRLSNFGTGGAADYITYLKRFEVLNRRISLSDKEAVLLAKFRSTDLQFKKIDEGFVWIIDMLYRVKTL